MKLQCKTLKCGKLSPNYLLHLAVSQELWWVYNPTGNCQVSHLPSVVWRNGIFSSAEFFTPMTAQTQNISWLFKGVFKGVLD